MSAVRKAEDEEKRAGGGKKEREIFDLSTSLVDGGRERGWVGVVVVAWVVGAQNKRRQPAR